MEACVVMEMVKREEKEEEEEGLRREKKGRRERKKSILSERLGFDVWDPHLFRFQDSESNL